ncbi:MAG: alpha/beta hydrolase [Segniliparus sp.]|uniref:alpha/beta hydrolase n=1 Tax=Segniliparus sp. TaxID=2804064 RepID=UPI003F3E1C5B
MSTTSDIREPLRTAGRCASAPYVLRHTTTSLIGRAGVVLLWLTARPAIFVFAMLGRLPWPDRVPSSVIRLLDVGARLLPEPRGSRFEEVRLPGCSARWYLPPRVPQQPERAVLYLHGGGFVACSAHTHKRLANHLGSRAGAGVLFVEYGQLPYYPVDETVRQCLDGYRWLLEQGWPPEKIVIAGDSAGGFLAFATALRAREEGLPLPSGLVAIAPFTDWDDTAKLAHPNIRLDSLFCKGTVRSLEVVVRRAQERAKRRGYPVRPLPDLFACPLEGMPPTMIHVSDIEMLLPDSEKLAAALAAAGVPTTLKIWAGQLHVFQAIVEPAPESRASLRELGAFIRAVAP